MNRFFWWSFEELESIARVCRTKNYKKKMGMSRQFIEKGTLRKYKVIEYVKRKRSIFKQCRM